MGISKTGGKEQGENTRKNLSVLQLQGRTAIFMLLYGYIYIDTFQADMEISTKRCLRGVLPLFKWFLNRQWMCKRGFGSDAYSRNVNGFATQ